MSNEEGLEHRLRDAIISYGGPLDVSLPIHPSTIDILGDTVDALAAHIAAALSAETTPQATHHDPADIRERIKALQAELESWGTTYPSGEPRPRLAASRIPRAVVLDGIARVLSPEAPPKRPHHDPSDHDCRGGVEGDLYDV